MNLVAWILSLVIEWMRPLEPADAALASDDIDPPRAASPPLGDAAVPGEVVPPEGPTAVEDVLTATNAGGAGDDVDADLLASDPVGSGLSRTNPLWGLADRLLEVIAPHPGKALGWAGWVGMLAVPAVAVAVLQALVGSLGAFGALLTIALHALVLYFTVPVGRLVRRIDRLSLLAAAGERAAMRVAVTRWSSGDRSGPNATFSGANQRADVVTPLQGGLSGSMVAARSAFALPLIDGYRDVFAPLFWYLLLGAAGPVAYGFARIAAERRAGAARSGLRWIDWVPIRLAAASLAFAGRFDDAMLGLRAGHDASAANRIDPVVQKQPAFAQQLVLLPAASGALGIRLTDRAVERTVQAATPDHEPPDAAPSPASFPALRALLGRAAMIWGGLWLLVNLIS
jgi:membrane protein required for beta-lactamase induction